MNRRFYALFLALFCAATLTQTPYIFAETSEEPMDMSIDAPDDISGESDDNMGDSDEPTDLAGEPGESGDQDESDMSDTGDAHDANNPAGMPEGPENMPEDVPETPDTPDAPEDAPEESGEEAPENPEVLETSEAPEPSEDLDTPDESAPAEEPVGEDGTFGTNPDKMELDSGKDMSLVKGDAASRADLIKQAEADEHAVDDIAEKLKAHKDKLYDRYRTFDEAGDQFFKKTGVGRGHVNEDIRDIKVLIVDEVLDGDTQSTDNEMEAKIKTQKEELEKLSTLIKDVSSAEAKILEQLQHLSSGIDSVLDTGITMGKVRREIKGVARDADAKSKRERVAKLREQAEAKEKELVGTLVPEVEKSFPDVEKIMKEGEELLAKLKESGIDFARYAKRVIDKAESFVGARAHSRKKSDVSEEGDHSEVHPEHEHEEPEVKTEEKRRKKKKKKKGSSGYGDMVLDGVITVGRAVWGVTQPVRDVIYTGYKAYIAPYVEELVDEEEDAPKKRKAKKSVPAETEKAVGGTDGDAVKKSDPVLKKIRTERENSKKSLKNLVKKKRMIEEKGKLLNKLEAERVMQIDDKEALMAELDSAHKRASREITWLELGQKTVIKLGRTLKRALKFTIRGVRRLIKAYQSQAESKSKKKKKKKQVESQDSQFVK